MIVNVGGIGYSLYLGTKAINIKYRSETALELHKLEEEARTAHHSASWRKPLS